MTSMQLRTALDLILVVHSLAFWVLFCIHPHLPKVLRVLKKSFRTVPNFVKI